MEPECPLLYSQEPKSPRRCVIFRYAIFYGEGVFAPFPTTKLKN